MSGTAELQTLLRAVRDGEVAPEDALDRLRNLPFRRVEGGHFDTHRELRTGIAEVIFAPGKADADLVRLAGISIETHRSLFVSRVTAEQATLLQGEFAQVTHHERARVIAWRAKPPQAGGRVAVVCAGTADLPVADEAAVTLEHLGSSVTRVADVGVAGLHRVLHHADALRKAHALVVVAGMEGALPTVVAGLVGKPIIAVPTSIGYGASFGGLAALLGMLNSCAPGVVVVNIDNGFGAGCAAHMIARQCVPDEDDDD